MARTALWRGQIDVLVDTIMVTMVGAPFVYDDTDQHLVDIAGKFGTPAVVPVSGVVDGEVHTGPFTYTGVAAGSTVTGLVTYVWSGDPVTSMLLGSMDRRADAVPLKAAGNGGDITFTFPDYVWKI